jgi:cytochrome c
VNRGCLLLAAVLTSLALGARTAAIQEGATGSVWDGVYSEEQAARGETAYRQACANCHGPELEGADMTPGLVGGVFTSNWNDLTLGDLYERIRVTMPLDKPGSLSRQQNVDLVAFLLKANQWPVGTTELPREPGALKQIRIQSSRPERKP